MLNKMAKKKLLISVDKLVPGFYIDLRLNWTQHPFLFSKFKIKSESEIRMIKKLDLTEVMFYPEKSEANYSEEVDDIEDFVDSHPDTPNNLSLWDQKKECISKADLYRQNRKKIAIKYRESEKRIKNLTSDLKTAPANAIRDAHQVIEDMAANFDTDTNVLVNLVNLSSSDFSFHSHSLNVTVLSMIVGRSLGLDKKELNALGIGALLHDIGKISIPGSVLYKKAPKTSSEIELLKTHVLAGARMVSQIDGVPQESIDVISRHHEFLDGSGYPAGFREESISLICRIVTIANIYDNLCNSNNPKLSMTPKAAMAILYAKYTTQLDLKIVQQFIRTFGIYPPGTVVKLSDDSIGLVVSVDPKELLKPTLILYNPDIPANQALLINLSDHDKLEVANVIKPGECPPRIYEYLGIQENMGYYFDTVKKG